MDKGQWFHPLSFVFCPLSLTLLENDVNVKDVSEVNVEVVVTLFSLVVMCIFFYVLFGKRMLKANGGIDGKSGFNLVTKVPKVKMADVAGNEEAKENLMDVIDFLKNPIEYQYRVLSYIDNYPIY